MFQKCIHMEPSNLNYMYLEAQELNSKVDGLYFTVR